MFTIGDFARHGRVSVRMLRHYDATGLLRPARVDPASGYRFYEASQLARLNRIIALKDLGFTLEQLRTMLDQQVSAAQLRAMLQLRQAELQSRIVADTARLAQVEVRLRIIEEEGAMPAEDIQVKPIAPVRVAELSAVAASLEPVSITPVIQPLYRELGRRLAEAGLRVCGPGIAWYCDDPDGDGVLVHATLPVNAEPGRADGVEADGTEADGVKADGVEIVDLPAIDHAATMVHRGSMDNCLASYQALAQWIEAHGYRSTGYARELYLDCPEDQDKWVTELQEPIAPR
jgi:DNA-binding transcriptional MerR regulator